MDESGRFRASDQERFRSVVDQIGERFGRVIDLDKSPFVIIEILREFGGVVRSEGGGGGGGVSPGVSTIAGSPPSAEDQVELADVMKAVLRLQRDLKDVKAHLGTSSPGA